MMTLAFMCLGVLLGVVVTLLLVEHCRSPIMQLLHALKKCDVDAGAVTEVLTRGANCWPDQYKPESKKILKLITELQVMTSEPAKYTPLPLPCLARQHSDAMLCKECRIYWDMNDPVPPECKRGYTR